MRANEKAALGLTPNAARETPNPVPNLDGRAPFRKLDEPAASVPRSRDIAQVLVFERSDRYRVRVVARERDGSRFLACVGEMLGVQGAWVPSRAFNFRRDELDALIDGLQRAKGILR